MTAQHGTRSCYMTGCRCVHCTEAQRLYQRGWLDRRANGEAEPGPPQRRVEAAVELELADLPAAAEQPGLAAAAMALAKVMDGYAQTAKPSAARVLVRILDDLHAASARDRRGSLKVVRAMTETPS